MEWSEGTNRMIQQRKTEQHHRPLPSASGTKDVEVVDEIQKRDGALVSQLSKQRPKRS